MIINYFFYLINEDNMRFERSAGILLHPTSLPGNFGIGDLGQEAFNFINFLEHAGQKLWQVFPLGPTGYGDSPYQCFSAFAGNPLLVSPEKLKDDGFLTDSDLSNIPSYDPHKIDYGSIINFKKDLFRTAYNNYKNNHNGFEEVFKKFCGDEKQWLEDFSLFMAAKDFHDGALWTEWDKELVLLKENDLKKWKRMTSCGGDRDLKKFSNLSISCGLITSAGLMLTGKFPEAHLLPKKEGG